MKYVLRVRQDVGELINSLQQPIIIDHMLERLHLHIASKRRKWLQWGLCALDCCALDHRLAAGGVQLGDVVCQCLADITAWQLDLLGS